MYKHYDPLTEEEVTTLVDLSRKVKYKDSYGSRCRIGKNKTKALSIYNYSKWFDWTSKQRDIFKVGFSEDIQNKAVQGWFLDIPAGRGFLDQMTTWVNKTGAGTIVATALKDRQAIQLNGRLIELRKGEQIAFNLSTVHAIPKSDHGQLWACVMIRGDFQQYT
ncbi:hypothetical protein [Pseudomonas phage PA1C]|uniref:Uncharacterized protein n=1 Tax=Pseudomonas phage vB_PaeM_PS119XW TaxID=2601632 RepID=A0A5C1K8R5_9CAUD|nr:hypothetical protein PP933_gp162 [Pseudomonas phage vB_PaeM_PS119XW]QBX32318.1 hypothetical protein [Pseudomonas phage PA1C]QEM41891.1 hypothetical protein [Pseudomonas phage vB_PaeM_PS119XW]BEG72406.1 hypothetical protein RVBP21_0340 [Pseudomonas phage BRkr]